MRGKEGEKKGRREGKWGGGRGGFIEVRREGWLEASRGRKRGEERRWDGERGGRVMREGRMGGEGKEEEGEKVG